MEVTQFTNAKKGDAQRHRPFLGFVLLVEETSQTQRMKLQFANNFVQFFFRFAQLYLEFAHHFVFFTFGK